MTRQCDTKNWRYVWSFLSMLCACCAVIACDGGLIGTSTGPTSNEGAVHLPRKIGPRIPLALLQNQNGSQSGATAKQQTRKIKSQRPAQQAGAISEASTSPPESTEMSNRIARNWQRLSPHFTRIETTRIALELELLVLELIYEQVLEYCQGQDANDCLIPAGQLQIDLVPAVLQRINSKAHPDASHDQTRKTDALLANIENRRMSFGELRIQRLQDQPFSNRLTVRPLVLMPNHNLSLQWTSDFSQIHYQLMVEEQQITQEEYHYQSSPSTNQRLAYQTFNETDNSNTRLEVSAPTLDTGDVAFRGRLGDDTTQGHSSDTVAFSTSTDIANQMITEEVFQATGQILDSHTCGFIAGSPGQDCDEIIAIGTIPGDVTDASPTIENPTADYSSFPQIQVLNLPATIETFEIRNELVGLPPSQWPELCHGWQSPFTQQIEMICYTSQTLAVGGVAVANDQMGNIYRIAGVELAIPE